jgi:hypothetical protein
MNKPKKTSNHSWKPWIIILLVVIIGGSIGIYASRNWIKHVYYGYEARATLNSQTEKLSSSLSTLGLKGASVTSKCTEESVFGYTTPQLQCIAGRQNYVVIGTDATSKANFADKAQEMDALLKSNGWVTTSNSASTLGEWFQGITTGKDYSTDIDSVRNSGNTHCSLVFNVAYSNPKPPAFVVRMSCSVPVLEKVKDNPTF